MKTPIKQKVSLTPPATFVAPVEIRMPGGAVAEVNFTFKHRPKASITELIASFSPPEGATDEQKESFVAPKDEDVILDIAAGWDLEDTFGRDAIKRMGEMYAGCERVILQAYLAELSGARVKN